CSELSFCLGGIPGIGCVSSWLFLAALTSGDSFPDGEVSDFLGKSLNNSNMLVGFFEVDQQVIIRLTGILAFGGSFFGLDFGDGSLEVVKELGTGFSHGLGSACLRELAIVLDSWLGKGYFLFRGFPAIAKGLRSQSWHLSLK
ncbi:13057_t:CDS:2, partial [Entrophospora sp. SA101]